MAKGEKIFRLRILHDTVVDGSVVRRGSVMDVEEGDASMLVTAGKAVEAEKGAQLVDVTDEDIEAEEEEAAAAREAAEQKKAAKRGGRRPAGGPTDTQNGDPAATGQR